MEVIGPAVEGTKNVLQACAQTKGGVKRVVLTSSVAAIYGNYNPIQIIMMTMIIDNSCNSVVHFWSQTTMHYHRLSSTVISFYLFKFDIIVDASFWCLNKYIMVCDNFAFSSSNLWILESESFLPCPPAEASDQFTAVWCFMMLYSDEDYWRKFWFITYWPSSISLRFIFMIFFNFTVTLIKYLNPKYIMV